MNTTTIKKRLLPTLAWVCLAPLASQNAQAATTFSSFANVTYTIDSITNATNPGDFSGLNIGGFFDLAPGGGFQFITGDGSVTPSLAGSGAVPITPAIGSSYSRTFQLDGTASNGGEVTANYLAWINLAFDNVSTTDSYQVGVTLSYNLSATATGDNDFNDVTLNYSADQTNAAGDITSNTTFSGTDYIFAAAPDLGTAALPNSHALTFNLAPNEFEALYTGSGITGALQASPVPVPSAIWLFASALLATAGLRKAKRTV